ncbi:uncharacterized protein LOC144172350 [Haemaphysalis longicornis]
MLLALVRSWRSPGFTFLLLLLVTATGGRRAGRAEDDEEEEQPWMNVARKDTKSQDSGSSSGFSYEDQDQTPPKTECEVDSFRRGQSECDRILRMNLPHHHGSHDYVCYSLRKYKMCVANVMIQSSCYERTFISQELHKIRGIIQGYSVDCFNITKETNRRGLKVRRLRYRMAKVKLSSECSPAAAWGVELTCTRDFETDMKALRQLHEPPKAVKKSCRAILRYYHCLTPVTESSSCQKNQEFIKHLEYFPKVITARYKETCLKELELSPALFTDKINTSMARVRDGSGCREEEAAREFLACALVFNEVVAQKNRDQYKVCNAFENFRKCLEMIGQTLSCGSNSQFSYHARNVMGILVYNYQNQCRSNKAKRGRSGGDEKPAVGTRPGNKLFAEDESTARTPSETLEGQRTRRKLFKYTDEVFRVTTENPFYPPLRKVPFEPRVPQADDYPRGSDEFERNQHNSRSSDRDQSKWNREGGSRYGTEEDKNEPSLKGGSSHGTEEGGKNEPSLKGGTHYGTEDVDKNEPSRKGGFRYGTEEGGKNEPGRRGGFRHGTEEGGKKEPSRKRSSRLGTEEDGKNDSGDDDVKSAASFGGAFRGPRGDKSHRNRGNGWDARRDDTDKDDSNDGFMEGSDDVESIHRLKKKLLQ